VRLEPQQVVAIREVVKANFGPDARVWLFGSRADDSLQGGDIDLYVETSLEHGLLDAKIGSQACSAQENRRCPG
jgi:predicted nucleotidyltransferase